MKKILLLLLFGALFIGVNAQLNQGTSSIPWYTTGNAATTSSNFLGTTDFNPVIFKTNNQERMRLLPDQLGFGIGTPTPNSPLHLHVVSSPGDNPIKLMEITSKIGLIKAENALGIYEQDEKITLGYRGWISNIYQSKLTFTSDGIVINSENPKHALVVNGSIEAVQMHATDGISAPSAGFVHLNADNANITNVLSAKSAKIVGGLNNNGLDIFYNRANLFLKQQLQGNFFLEGPGGGLTIAPNSNIGIGTETPAEKLQVVNGNLLISKSPASTSSGSVIFKLNSAHQNAWGIEYVNSTTEGFGLNFWSYKDLGDPQKVYQKYSILFLSDSRDGNVGIGTKSPAAKLDVAGSFNAWSAKISGKINAQSAEITGTLSANTLNVQNLNLGDTVSFKELNTNNVNVKNRVSAYDLRASSSAVIDGYVRANALYVDGARIYEDLEVDSSLYVKKGAVIYGTLQAKNIRIEETLCVREIRVMNDPCWHFPDYVFAKDYNLMPISEVEQFITENQHLPGVPPAAEVEANGMNLGEINIILVQKVEELTLYVIQLQKQIDELKQTKGGE